MKVADFSCVAGVRAERLVLCSARFVHVVYRCRSDPKPRQSQALSESWWSVRPQRMAVETKMAAMSLDKASINDIDVKDKRVLMRVDFNVPQDKKTGEITNNQRIVGAMPTIELALSKGAKAGAPRRTCSRRALVCRSLARPPRSGPPHPRLGSHSDVAPGSPRRQAQPIDDAQAGRRAVRRANPNQHTVDAA